jgi:hypothetical protein
MWALAPGKGHAMQRNSRTLGRFLRRISTVLISFTAGSLQVAMAQEVDVTRDNGQPRREAQVPHFLPGGLSAELDSSTTVTGNTLAGYNGATSTPVLSATSEAWIVPRVSLMVGFGTTPQPGTVSVRAQGGARVLILDQGHYGLNAAVGFLYRQDRFANEEGMLEWSALVSRRWGATMAIANLTYAQDGEGDDHEGEIRLVGLRDLGSGLHLALDNRLRTSLGSSDPHRAQHSNPTLEFNAGPLLAYTIGRLALVTEAGVSGQKVDQLRVGVLVLGGVSAAF